jgi:hypothetical protein
MGYKSVLRSVSAAQKRQEREAKRHQRELEKQRKQLVKMQQFEQARFEVEEFENYIEVITSVHKECGSTWDWEAIRNRPAPKEPLQDWFADREYKARKAFAEYEPGRSDRLLRRVDSRRKELAMAIKAAEKQDAIDFEEAQEEFKANLEEWEAYQYLSGRILEGDPEAYVDAIKIVDPFSEISELGSSLNFSTKDGKLFYLSVHVNGEDIIPSKSKSLLQSGKLSVKNTTKSRFYELYQDHVCGCALRVARELFALLPAEMAVVTATADLLNTSTGHIEAQPILSVAMPRVTLDGLNFDSLDPSDSMNNFVHNMKFLKTKGFRVVEKIESTAFQPNNA